MPLAGVMNDTRQSIPAAYAGSLTLVETYWKVTETGNAKLLV